MYIFVIRTWPGPLERGLDVREKWPGCPREEGRPRPQHPQWRPGAQPGTGHVLQVAHLGEKATHPQPCAQQPNFPPAPTMGTQELCHRILAHSDTRFPTLAIPRGLIALRLPSRGPRDRTISWTFPPGKFSSLTSNSIQRSKIRRSRRECDMPAPPPRGVRTGPSPTPAPSTFSGSPPAPPPLRHPALGLTPAPSGAPAPTSRSHPTGDPLLSPPIASRCPLGI